MRKLLPLITLCVLGIIVVLLGIFAYRMASDTLVFAFYGQEEQFGDTMHIALDRPGTISRIFPAGTLLDDEAILGSILYNEKSLDELPENTVTLEVGEGAIRIRGNAMEAGDTIRLSALLYNAQKRTSYKIPHDVLLTAQSVTRRVAITEKGNPKQTTFSVHMTGYDPMEADRIRWYEYSPIAGEGCESQGFLWNARNYRAVKAHKILSNTQSEKENIEYQVEYNPLKSRQCLIAGI